MSGKRAPRTPGGLWAAAVMVGLAVLSAPGAEGRDSPEDFVYQFKFLCYFTNGTQRVRLVASWVYNLEEHVRFDSDVGKFVAVTELGRPDAKYWNGQEDVLERKRAEVDTVCKHNYRIEMGTTLQRRVAPKVTVSPAKTEALNHHNLLVCSVTDFYPSQVKVRWFRNDQEETGGVVSTTPLIRNGDWTYQILVMLEMTPQRGDVYTCHVEHPSLQSPVTVQWRKGQFVSFTAGPTDRGQAASPGHPISSLFPLPPLSWTSQGARALLCHGRGLRRFLISLCFQALGRFLHQAQSPAWALWRTDCGSW